MITYVAMLSTKRAGRDVIAARPSCFLVKHLVYQTVFFGLVSGHEEIKFCVS